MMHQLCAALEETAADASTDPPLPAATAAAAPSSASDGSTTAFGTGGDLSATNQTLPNDSSSCKPSIMQQHVAHQHAAGQQRSPQGLLCSTPYQQRAPGSHTTAGDLAACVMAASRDLSESAGVVERVAAALADVAAHMRAAAEQHPGAADQQVLSGDEDGGGSAAGLGSKGSACGPSEPAGADDDDDERGDDCRGEIGGYVSASVLGAASRGEGLLGVGGAGDGSYGDWGGHVGGGDEAGSSAAASVSMPTGTERVRQVAAAWSGEGAAAGGAQTDVALYHDQQLPAISGAQRFAPHQQWQQPESNNAASGSSFYTSSFQSPWASFLPAADAGSDAPSRLSADGAGAGPPNAVSSEASVAPAGGMIHRGANLLMPRGPPRGTRRGPLAGGAPSRLGPGRASDGGDAGAGYGAGGVGGAGWTGDAGFGAQ